MKNVSVLYIYIRDASSFIFYMLKSIQMRNFKRFGLNCVWVWTCYSILLHALPLTGSVLCFWACIHYHTLSRFIFFESHPWDANQCQWGNLVVLVPVWTALIRQWSFVNGNGMCWAHNLPNSHSSVSADNSMF